MASALDPVEDAVHLLREGGLSTAVLHWIGSVPFAFGALASWRTLTAPRVPEETCARVAFALVLLLIWMSFWRAAFAIRLRTRAFGQLPVRLSPDVLLHIARNQCFFGGLKLWVLPFAAFAVLPLPWAVAFFRNSTVYADFELSQSISRARKLAGFAQGQNAVGILIFSGLALIVFVNFGLALAMLPQLGKTFTGVESVYTRSGVNLLLQPLFFLTALFCSWLAIDPLVQAYYVIRCFRGDSVETGADVRARLSLLRSTTRAAVVLLLLVVPALPIAAQVSPGEFDRALEGALQSKEYDWRLPGEPAGSSRDSWVVSFTDQMVEQARHGLRTLAHWVDRLMKWLQDSSAPAPAGPAPGAELLGGLYLLIALVLAAGGFALWRMRRRRKATAAGPLAVPLAIDLRDEGLTADRLPEEEWYSLAEDRLARGDVRAAIRALFLANLAWLHARRLIAIHQGKTNREYERELRRRGRAGPEALPLLRQNIDAFERAWYGIHPAGLQDIDQFRSRLQQMKEILPA